MSQQELPEIIISHLSKLETKFDKLEEKVDTIRESLHSVEKVSVKQEENLKEHMRRTDIAELRIATFEEQVKPLLASLNSMKMLTTIISGIILVLTLVKYFN